MADEAMQQLRRRRGAPFVSAQVRNAWRNEIPLLVRLEDGP